MFTKTTESKAFHETLNIKFMLTKTTESKVFHSTHGDRKFSTVHRMLITVHTVTASYPQYTECQMFVDETHGDRKFSTVH